MNKQNPESDIEFKAEDQRSKSSCQQCNPGESSPVLLVTLVATVCFGTAGVQIGGQGSFNIPLSKCHGVEIS